MAATEAEGSSRKNRWVIKVYWEDHIAWVIVHSQANCQAKELGRF